MKDDLMRRISDALDAPGGLDADDELRAVLADDAEARAYAQDLVRVGAVLEGLGRDRISRDVDWDAFADRIEAHLDDALDPLPGLDEAPVFRDEGDRAQVEIDPNVSQEVPRAQAASVIGAAAAPVVDLASRRRSRPFVWMGGLAAAAAVGLGIMFGMTSFDASPEPMLAQSAYDEEAAAERSAPASAEAPPPPAPSPAAAPVVAQAPAPDPAPAVPAGPGVWPAEPAAEPPAELPAVAAVSTPQPTQAPLSPMRAAGSGGSRADLEDPFGGGRGEAAADGLSRRDVLAAMQSVEPQVQRCLASRGELANVHVQVGASGSIVSVRVDAPYTGADARCIVDAVRTLSFPTSAAGFSFMHRYHPAAVAGGSLARPPAAARRQRTRAAARPPPADPRRTSHEILDAWSR